VADRCSGVGERVSAVDDGADLAAGGHSGEIGEPLSVRRLARDLHAQAQKAADDPGLPHQPDRTKVQALARVPAARQHQPAARGDDSAQVAQARLPTRSRTTSYDRSAPVKSSRV
jgi:hypothetical protein